MAAPGVLDTERLNLLTRFGRSYGAGEVIFHEGDSADRAYLVHTGRVRIVKKIGAVERALRVLRNGELFGETAWLMDRKREATAISLTPCDLLGFDAASFRELLSQNPEVGLGVVQQLVLRAREAEDRVEISMVRDAQSKVVIGLLRSAPRYLPAAPDEALLLPITPLELSSKVGLDVEAVKRTMQQLRDNGYVRIINEQIEVPSLDALQELRNLLDTREEILGGDAA
jgi:CRP-like cAMP-binding protein